MSKTTILVTLEREHSPNGPYAGHLIDAIQDALRPLTDPGEPLADFTINVETNGEVLQHPFSECEIEYRYCRRSSSLIPPTIFDGPQWTEQPRIPEPSTDRLYAWRVERIRPKGGQWSDWQNPVYIPWL